MEEYISREEYNLLLRELENERLAHAQTKRQLLETEDKLDFAQGEIEVLTKQLEREKAQFERTFGMLRTKALKETVKSVELETRCSAVEKQCSKQGDVLSTKEREVEELRQQLRQQEQQYQQQLAELNVQRQQEAYMAQLQQQPGRGSHTAKSGDGLSAKSGASHSAKAGASRSARPGVSHSAKSTSSRLTKQAVT